ncbi:MAG: tRNA (adenosine(37)-N6)-dimethylallyltransferase MiaA [bacterium]|nr:tRNA (adenosine(37)-N6)-dimethylallyltransferase MiaA [bacterium]
MKSGKYKVIAVVGPTAVGKSALAVELAKRFNGEVISADSRQVYQGLTIGTGKITKREMLGIPHHLLDVASPRGQYSVARYVKEGHRTISEIVRRKKLPIVVGGTGLYIDALLGEMQFPDVPPNPALRKKLAKKSTSELFSLLKKLDLKRAKTIDRHNPRRLVRAIEIARTAKLTPVPEQSSVRGTARNLKRKTDAKSHLYKPLYIGLVVPREKLQKRIAKRLVRRIKGGMIAEVRNLHTSSMSWKRLDSLGLEYRYVAQHLRGLISEKEMVAKLQTEIWHYAKRQMTWFRRNKKIKWFTPKELLEIRSEIIHFLG